MTEKLVLLRIRFASLSSTASFPFSNKQKCHTGHDIYWSFCCNETNYHNSM